ncbi:MAG: rhomboid family intramembrane serine protease [Mucilaginibacter polytrichastri]|nr:rhomboid family intramembrane serine protease [Mucilaginibacter polytrichastri]
MAAFDELRYKVFQSGKKVYFFIGLNVAIFVVLGLVTLVENWFLRSDSIGALLNNYLAVPANLQKLLYRFWTPLTYQFLHAGFFHILFNMLWLYWIGQIFEEYLGSKKFTFTYLLGGVAGALLFILAYNVIPLFSEVRLDATTVGASASVMAIIVGTATLLPDYTIFMLFLGPVKLKWLVIVYVLIDLLSAAGPNAGGSIAHIGGALFGFFYVKSLRSGNDWNRPFERAFSRKPKLRVVRNEEQHSGAPDQAEIDRILDKISQTGYKGLTKKERDTLARASK